MHYDGIIIGAAAFAIIGIFHPVVIKGEYYFGVSIWPLFAVSGAAMLLAAVYIDHFIIRSILGITGFTFLWSIIELFHQRERVRKGWYPENPRRKK
jgi:Domain of unknown function (DUF4491)